MPPTLSSLGPTAVTAVPDRPSLELLRQVKVGPAPQAPRPPRRRWLAGLVVLGSLLAGVGNRTPQKPEIVSGRALRTMLLILCPLVGYGFFQAVALYAEASSAARDAPVLASGLGASAPLTEPAAVDLADAAAVPPAGPRRIIGIAADIDDESVIPGPALVVYHPMEQEFGGGRLFVHARTDPYALVPPITRIIRDLSPDQPVERAATLDDVRAEVLSPNRINAMVFSGFAGVALAIAIVGVAGVLAFSVSARTREFGVRLAIGSTPAALLTRIVREGSVIGMTGIVAGARRSSSPRPPRSSSEPDASRTRPRP